MPNPPAIRYGMDRAFYRPSDDLVGMLDRKAFESEHEFFSTILCIKPPEVPLPAGAGEGGPSHE